MVLGCFYGLVDQDADKEPGAGADEPSGETCRCGAPMVFIPLPEARRLMVLHSKGATNCLPGSLPAAEMGAGIGPRAGPGG